MYAQEQAGIEASPCWTLGPDDLTLLYENELGRQIA
jgi:hypothetical protein